MKKIILILGTMVPFVLQAQNSFTIEGKFSDITDTIHKVYLRYKSGSTVMLDSTIVKNNSYSFKGVVEEPVLANLSANKMNTGVFIENGKIQISHQQRFSAVKVTGSSSDLEYRKLQETLKPYQQKQEILYKEYASYRKENNKAGLEKTEAAIDLLDEDIKENVYGSFLKTGSNSPIALYAIQQYAGYDIDPDKVAPYLNSLPETVKKYPSAVAMQDRIATARKTGLGQMALEFTQNDTLGNPVALQSFRGRYLLVDFWASWCGPCRAENPNVVLAFKKYEKKGFHVLGVSLDRPDAKEKWMKAIHDDQLTWTHVSDLQFWNNAVAKLYGINAIPQNYLIDPNGKIIAKNLRGDALQSKLAAIFPN